MNYTNAIYLKQSLKLLNILTVNCMSTQVECIEISYDVDTVKANIEQMNVITKRITLKTSASHAIRQDIKHGPIIVKFKFRKKIGSEQVINLNHSHTRHQRNPQTQKHQSEDNSIKQHL